MNREERRKAERAAARSRRRETSSGGGAVPVTVTPPVAPAARAAPDGRAATHVHRAVALLDQGRAEDAARACRRALAADRRHLPAHVLLGRALRVLDRLDEALLACRRAVALAPDSAEAWAETGITLKDEDRVVESLRALRRATALDPDSPELLANLGATLTLAGQPGAALAPLERAVERAPALPGARNNLAVALSRMGDFERAVAAYEAALALTPDDPTLRNNLGLCLLGTGDLGRGWELQEAGFAAGQRMPDRRFAVPRWDGSDLTGRTVLVWREQGVGDEIRLASCYPDVVERAGHVIIECEPRLLPLVARSFPAATVRAQTFDAAAGRETLPTPDFEVECPAATLPRHLRPTIGDFPDHDGFLRPDPALRERWRDRLGRLGPGPKVGICWRSMNLTTGRLGYYTALSEWAPVLREAGAHLVNLQYGPTDLLDAELTEARDRFGATVHRWDDVDYTDDFDAVAALISELDLVVSVGTAVSALAGAVGRSVALLTVEADPYRLGADHYPWFPSFRLLPRGWDEPWTGPLREAAAIVRDLAGRSGGA